MKKFKDWLLLRFLPAWAKETVYKENYRLLEKIAEQKSEIDRLNAYIDGLEYAVRRSVIVKNEVRQ